MIILSFVKNFKARAAYGFSCGFLLYCIKTSMNAAGIGKRPGCSKAELLNGASIWI